MSNEVTQDDLRRIYEKLDAINRSVATIEATCPTCRDQIAENRRVIRGNGEGLLTRTAVLEKRLVEVEQDVKSSDSNPRLTLKQWAAIFALMTAMGIFGMGGSYLASAGQQAHPSTTQEHDK